MENYAAKLRDAKQHILIDHRLHFLSAYSIDPHPTITVFQTIFQMIIRLYNF